jgi:hypothetical protein
MLENSDIFVTDYHVNCNLPPTPWDDCFIV